MKKRIIAMLMSAAMVAGSVIPAMAAETAEWNDVNEILSDAGTSIVNAEPIKFGTNYRTKRGLEGNDWYKFTLTSSGLVEISGKGSNGALTMQVYDEDDLQNPKAQESYAANSVGVLSLNTYLRLNKGNYYLVYKPRYGWEDQAGGEYEFKVKFTSAGESFAEKNDGTNNSIDTASVIKLNTNYTGQLGNNDTDDYYKVTLPKAEKVTVKVTGNAVGGFALATYDKNKMATGYDEYVKKTGETLGDMMELDLPAGITYLRFYNTDDALYKFRVISKQGIKTYALDTASAKNLTYTGSKLTPSFTVKGKDGKTLEKGKGYTVSVSPSTVKEIGTYTATIKGKGTYTGTKKITFQVKPKGTSISSLSAGTGTITVKFKAQTKNTDGYKIQYSTDKNFKKNVTTKTIKKSAGSAKFEDLASGKTFYVRIATYKKAKDKKTYISSYSAVKSVKTK